MPKLTLADIADLREYEKQREGFRRSIIELKRIRRIPLGELVTVVFENRDTVKFQIQEMARAEKMLREEQIETELRIYNTLIPEFGEIKATLFLELTTKEMLERWLPALVGIERSVYFGFTDGDSVTKRMSQSEGSHRAQLTRDDVTASVHYIEWIFDESDQRLFRSGSVILGVDHPQYQAQTELGVETIESLVADWNV